MTLTAGAGDNEGNLAARLEDGAGGWLDAPAFIAGGAVTTHRQVHEGAARVASVLAGAGVGAGDRVLIVLPDGVEMVWAFLATVRLGAMAVLANPALPAADHRRMAQLSRPKVVFCGAESEGRWEDVPALGGAAVAVAASGARPHPAVAVPADHPAYAQFTSGTTGWPKAAVHRHADPFTYHLAFAQGAIGLRPADVVLSISKMYFAYGLGNSMFFPLLSGCRAVLQADRPTPDNVADLMERHRVSVLFAVPTFYAHLVGRSRPGPYPSLRVAVTAGEVLTAALADRAAAHLGCPLLDGLGSTEVGQTFISNTLWARRPGTVGRALPPYQVEVRNDDRIPLPGGRVGTLWVRGPSVMLEYLDDPAATAAAKDGEWLCTRDRASIDAAGFVTLYGRVDDMEMVSGISVAPQEIEEVLLESPEVVEVAVVSVRLADGASRLEAFVVPSPEAGAALPERLTDLARRRLAGYKVPRAVHLVPSLPRTPNGKIRRVVLRAGASATQLVGEGQGLP